MRNLVIPAVLVLTMTLAPMAALAGENPGGQPMPALSQQVSDTELGQLNGKVRNPADFAQVSRNTSTTLKVAGDTVNFSQHVIDTMNGYNTNPPTNPSCGPSGSQIGPNSNVGPTWAQGGRDITMHNR
jgi:hypothetical protein